jgi:periplasmic divalent cation tolerance protein
MLSGFSLEAWRLAQVQQNDKPVLVYSTFPTTEAAEAIGTHLVEQRLAACVNILAPMSSIYRWDGKIVRDSEAVMIIKTRGSLVEALMAAVRSLHSYSNPALVVLPLEGGSSDYIAWLLEATGASVAEG